MDEFACKRLALEIAHNMPPSQQDAIKVLDLVRELVIWSGETAEIVAFPDKRQEAR